MLHELELIPVAAAATPIAIREQNAQVEIKTMTKSRKVLNAGDLLFVDLRDFRLLEDDKERDLEHRQGMFSKAHSQDETIKQEDRRSWKRSQHKSLA